MTKRLLSEIHCHKQFERMTAVLRASVKLGSTKRHPTPPEPSFQEADRSAREDLSASELDFWLTAGLGL